MLDLVITLAEGALCVSVVARVTFRLKPGSKQFQLRQ